MAIKYDTLEEAARLLNVSPDELKLMSRRGKPRPFKDGGTFQFRVTEIDEMARERGGRSDPELTLREGQLPQKKRTSGVKRPPSEEQTIPPPDVKKRTSGLKPVRSEEQTLPPPDTKKRTSGLKPGRSEEPTIPPPSSQRRSELKRSPSEEPTVPPPGAKRKSEVKPPKADEGVFDFELSSEDVDLGSKGAGDKPRKSGGKLAPTSGSDSDVRLVPDGSEVDFKVTSDSDPRNVESPPKRSE